MKKENRYVYAFEGGLYLNLTNRCCNACSFCIRNNGDGIRGNVLRLADEPTAEQVTEQIRHADFSYSDAVFCGYGEPTYRMDILPALADYLHGRNKRVRLNTNGLGDLINGRNIVPDLVGRVDRVSVSLNASTADGYVRLCHPTFGQSSFAALLDFAKHCKAAGIDTVFTMVDVLGEGERERCRALAEEMRIPLRVRSYITDNVEYT